MMNREYSPQGTFERRDQSATELPLNSNAGFNYKGQNHTFYQNPSHVNSQNSNPKFGQQISSTQSTLPQTMAQTISGGERANSLSGNDRSNKFGSNLHGL